MTNSNRIHQILTCHRSHLHHHPPLGAHIEVTTSSIDYGDSSIREHVKPVNTVAVVVVVVVVVVVISCFIFRRAECARA